MKKLLSLALSFLFIFGAVGCNRRADTTNDNTANDTTRNAVEDSVNQNYYNGYTRLYDESIGTLGSNNMYNEIYSVDEAYRGKTYPGNRQYVKDIRAAYKESREKIQSFVDGLRNDTKTDDTELKRMNEDLISEGEKLIQDIDNKMSKLDKITADDYNKSEDDFVKMINETLKPRDDEPNRFRDMLKDMDKRLGIDRKTMEDNNNNNK